MLITAQHIFLFCLKPNMPGVLSTGDKVLLLPLKNAVSWVAVMTVMIAVELSYTPLKLQYGLRKFNLYPPKKAV